MGNLKLKVDDHITITANDEICKGFYCADETSTVEKNNKVLGINFDPISKNPEPQHRITKVADYSFVTTKSVHGYLQHIIAPSINEASFTGYVNSLGFPEVREMLFTAFGLKGRFTLG
jgi:hypothetical protein